MASWFSKTKKIYIAHQKAKAQINKAAPSSKQVVKEGAKKAVSKGLELLGRPASAFLTAAKHNAQMEKKKPGSSWSAAGIKGGAKAFVRGLTGKEYTSGKEYLQTKGAKPSKLTSVSGAALEFALTPGSGRVTKEVGKYGTNLLKNLFKKGGTKFKPKFKPPKVEQVVKSKGGAPKGGGAPKPEPVPTGSYRPQTSYQPRTVSRPSVTQTRAPQPTVRPTPQLQSTSLVPVGQRSLVPVVQRGVGAGAQAGARAGASGLTQAARAAQAGARTLGTRVANVGANIGAGLATGARVAGQGLRTAGQTLWRYKKPIGIAGALGGTAYLLRPEGGPIDDQTQEPETPEETGVVPEQPPSYPIGGYPSNTIGGYPSNTIGGYNLGGMTASGAGIGAAVPGLDDIKNELFSLIDSSAGQSSAMTASWLNQMLDSINQMEQQLIAQYNQQGTTLDPATKAALDQLRQEVALKRQTLMEDLNRRGILQSGIWLEEENRLNQGLLTSQEQLLASRLSDIQNRLNEAMQNFASQRLNIMGTAWENEMQNAQWAQQARLEALQNLYQQQQAQNQWAAEYGLDVAKYNLSREKAASGTSNTATKQAIQKIPQYGSLQEALRDFNTYKEDMAAMGVNIAQVLQNIYAYFGSR